MQIHFYRQNLWIRNENRVCVCVKRYGQRAVPAFYSFGHFNWNNCFNLHTKPATAKLHNFSSRAEEQNATFVGITNHNSHAFTRERGPPPPLPPTTRRSEQMYKWYATVVRSLTDNRAAHEWQLQFTRFRPTHAFSINCVIFRRFVGKEQKNIFFYFEMKCLARTVLVQHTRYLHLSLCARWQFAIHIGMKCDCVNSTANLYSSAICGLRGFVMSFICAYVCLCLCLSWLDSHIVRRDVERAGEKERKKMAKNSHAVYLVVVTTIGRMCRCAHRRPNREMAHRRPTERWDCSIGIHEYVAVPLATQFNVINRCVCVSVFVCL